MTEQNSEQLARRAWNLLLNLACSGYYGTVTFEFRDGKITRAVKEETLKPEKDF